MRRDHPVRREVQPRDGICALKSKSNPIGKADQPGICALHTRVYASLPEMGQRAAI
jgi:hypothetical protein